MPNKASVIIGLVVIGFGLIIAWLGSILVINGELTSVGGNTVNAGWGMIIFGIILIFIPNIGSAINSRLNG